MKLKFVGFVCSLFAVTSFAATPPPAIIPLPQQMQLRAGTFTLCPTPTPGIPAHATTKILVEGSSQATAQYLAALLLRSTGYQFEITTNSGVSAVKGAILLTTINPKSLGAEGYELTVAPDSVVIRALQPRRACSMACNRCSNCCRRRYYRCDRSRVSPGRPPVSISRTSPVFPGAVT